MTRFEATAEQSVSGHGRAFVFPHDWCISHLVTSGLWNLWLKAPTNPSALLGQSQLFANLSDGSVAINL